MPYLTLSSFALTVSGKVASFTESALSLAFSFTANSIALMSLSFLTLAIESVLSF
jgi:cytochrome c biogenesis factor